MYDFGRFCYLDVQKTGSTFIGELLKECSRCPLINSSKHAPVRSLTRPAAIRLLRKGKIRALSTRSGYFRKNTVYFNSIRNPFNYYASLYNYGCDGKGSVHKKLRDAGLVKLYDGTPSSFLKWCEFILDPQNAALLSRHYSPCAEVVGFFTYRFMRLSFRDPDDLIPKIENRATAAQFYTENTICSATIRMENMERDFLHIGNYFLHPFIELDKALHFFQRGHINASSSKAATASALKESAIGNIVRERDFVIFNLFYPPGDMVPKGLEK